MIQDKKPLMRELLPLLSDDEKTEIVEEVPHTHTIVLVSEEESSHLTVEWLGLNTQASEAKVIGYCPNCPNGRSDVEHRAANRDITKTWSERPWLR